MDMLKCKVVMLPQDQQAPIWLGLGGLRVSLPDKICPGPQEYQHLYLTSDREIQNDWVYNSFSGKVESFQSSIPIDPEGIYRIEATTDPALWYDEKHVVCRDIPLIPKIPQSFIEKYVKVQGKIDEVLIEMSYKGQLFDEGNTRNSYHPKTRTDGTVIVRRLKTLFTKEELLNAYKAGFMSSSQGWCGEYPFGGGCYFEDEEKRNEKQLNTEAEEWFNETHQTTHV
jgi:hypothetical protein